MERPTYFPKGKRERIAWVRNFHDKFASQAPLCGLTAGEIAECLADLQYYLWIMTVWCPAVENLNKQTISYREFLGFGGPTTTMHCPTLPVLDASPPFRSPGILPRLFAVIKYLKASPGYNNEVIGRELKILPVATLISDYPYPPFTLRLLQGAGGKVVQINFKKHGHAGVYIESRTNNAGWEFLAIDNTKPNLDRRSLRSPGTPEIREYRLRWWDLGEAHGEWSPVQHISVIA